LLLGSKIYVVHGPENIEVIRKYKTSITSPGIQSFCLIRVFNMALEAVNAYNIDNSGIQQSPLPHSNVAPHNRVDFQTHAGFIQLLSGDGLQRLYMRWSSSFARRLDVLDIRRDEWTESSSIMDFWLPPLVASLNEALAGPILETLNPNFTQNFIAFVPYAHALMKGLPRWLAPEAHRLRNSLTRDVKQWQDIARGCFRAQDVASDGDSDPWWGSAFFRHRQQYLMAVDAWDHEAVASSDFGLLWGANINVHTAAIWTIVEVFKDAQLLSRVRMELEDYNYGGGSDLSSSSSSSSYKVGTSKEDIDLLLQLPLLQSVCAEVLRLRVEVQHVLYSEREDIVLNEHRFPPKHVVTVPTRPAHHDEKVWNTCHGKHPLDRFWSDRFLVYPGDPNSGPLRPKKHADGEAKVSPVGRGTPRFRESGTADCFIPYGVGERTCPGRFFARREIIAFCASIVQNFDLEILTQQQHIPSNDIFYGLGTQNPDGKIPFRIRKRQS
jgi:cytochrome P450